MQKMRDELSATKAKMQKYEMAVNNMQKLLNSAGNSHVDPNVIKRVLSSQSEQEAEKIISEYNKTAPRQQQPSLTNSNNNNNNNTNNVSKDAKKQPDNSKNKNEKSKTCTVL